MKNRQHPSTLVALAVAAASANVAAGFAPDETFIGPVPMRAQATPPAPREPVAPPKKDAELPKPEWVAPFEPAPVRQPVTPLVAPNQDAQTPLISSKPKSDALAAAPATAPSSTGSLGVTKTILSLSAVVALILLIAGVVKKLSGRVGGLASAIGAGGKAPSGILTILGRYPLDRRTTLILLKADRRVLLLSQSRGNGRLGTGGSTLTTLSEFTADADVASIVAKASAAEGKAPSQRFQQALEDESVMADEPVRTIAPPKPAKKQSEHEALAAMLRAAVEASKQDRTAPAAERPARATTQTGADAAAELRTRLAAMRAKAALGVGARRTEMVA